MGTERDPETQHKHHDDAPRVDVERRGFFRRKEDWPPDYNPRYYRDVLILFTLALVLGMLALAIGKFSSIAGDLKESNAKLEANAQTLKENDKALRKVNHKVIRANLQGCKGQNKIRTILRRDKKYAIKQSHVTDYSIFFPGVDPAVLHKAIHKQNRILQRQIRTDLVGRHCHQIYPDA